MILKRANFIYVLIFCAVTFSVTAENIVTIELPTQKQLPMAQVSRVFQDSEGYMWYGTDGGGLCRDDGYSIEVFRSDFNTPDLLENNSITCIAEDNRQRIWFGTKRGLYILDKKDYQVVSLDDKEIEHWTIDAILAASDSTVWVSAGNRIFHYDTEGYRQGTYPVKWNDELRSISQIYEDSRSNIWIAQWRGGLFRFDPEQNDFISVSWPFNESPTCFIEDVFSNGYWVATLGKGIVYYDPDKEKFTINTMPGEPNYSSKHILWMVQDTTRKKIWTITTDSLFAYETAENGRLIPMKTDVFLPSGEKNLNQIITDRNGNIWVPSYYAHTFILSFPGNQASRYAVPQMEKTVGQPASPLSFVYAGEYYWFAQRRGGLFLCNPENNNLLSVAHFPNFIGAKLSPIVVESKDRVGIFTVMNNNEVVWLRLDGGKSVEKEEVVNLPVDDWIRALHEDQVSNLWIGTSNNLFRYNLLLGKLDNPVKNIGIINNITVLPSGRIFLATEKHGLSVITPGQEMLRYGVGENFSTITQSPDQTIWAGTQQGNVYYFDPIKNDIVAVTEECGLNGDGILAIEVDRSGYIWILTDQRIIVYDPADKFANVIYNSDLSVSMNNFLSLYRDVDGTIHIGGTGGFCAFSAYSGFDNGNEKTSVTLSSIKINGDRRLTGYGEEALTLQPKEQNVELFFSTLDHLNAGNTRYAFRYGDSESWNYLPEGQNNIFLTGLLKGRYTLEVKATNKYGRWGRDSTTIQLHRLPAWYETTLAYILYILIVLTVIGIILRYYVKWKNQKSINEQIQNSAKDLQELASQLSEDILVPVSTDGSDVKSLLKSLQKTLEQQKEQKSLNTPNDNTLSASDEKFIRKALDYVERNIDNSDYSVEQLSRDMCMDRTGLYRKLVSIIGKTPTSFIRSTRLKRAARLLEEGHTVSEAAYQVGFGTASYLSKCFQEEFGVKPSQYIASHKKVKNT